MKIFTDIRFVTMLLLVIASASLIGLPYVFNSGAVVVESVDEGNECNFKEGDTINQIYSAIISDLESYEKALQNIREGNRVTMLVNSAAFGCNAPSDKSLGIKVRQTKIESLNFGIDIEGGTRVILRPVEEISRNELLDTVTTLENRINFFGLKEVKVNILGNSLIQIEMSGTTGDDIRDFLAQQGKFEGKLSYLVTLVGNEGSLRIGNTSFDIEKIGDQIEVENKRYSVNEKFDLNGNTFQAVSIGNRSVLVYADLFTGEDIIDVLTDSSNAGVGSVGGGFYEFQFGVATTRESAEKFAELTKGQQITRTSSRDSYISSQLVLILDNVTITELNIASSLAGQPITVATISGTEDTLEAANIEKLRLESTLRSGSLPVKLEIEKVDTITQTAGHDLINSTIFVALASMIAVIAIVLYRYRDYQIVIPMVIISLLEILIVVGMASSQIFAGIVIAAAFIIGIWKREVFGWIGWVTLFVMVIVASTVVVSPWTIDIPVIAGLIAILGTGVNQMIIMTDQLFKEKGRPLEERHKTAMGIIWSSAATVVFAMIPLLIGGVGILKGFAIATTIGVLVGILITRPAYISLIEKIKNVKLEAVAKKDD